MRFIGPVSKQLSVLIVGAGLLSGSAYGLSDQYETPPEQDPSSLLDGKENGPGYAVLSPVRSNGLMRNYELQGDQGVEQIEGDGLLQHRLAEIRAFVALSNLKNDASFVDGLTEAAKKPAKFVESAITDPSGTAKNTVSGVGRMFGRLSKGVEAVVTGKGGSAGEIAASITGQARARRELAVQLGVDPYTFDNALSEKLDETAGVTTAGNWTVSAITALIPGGMIVNATRTADNFRTVIIDSSPAELQERTLAALRKALISETTISQISGNTFFTPSEKAVIAYRLQAMPSVGGLELIAEKIATADSREAAYYHLRQLVLLENYNTNVSGLGQIRLVADTLVAIRRDGSAAIVLPLDMVAWTEATAQKFSVMQEEIDQLPFPPTGVDFLITGDLTKMAAERITSLGWDITGNFPMPEGPVQ
ncbi:MAG: hypothetical protein ABJL55_05120 [Roseibium sp.]